MVEQAKQSHAAVGFAIDARCEIPHVEDVKWLSLPCFEFFVMHGTGFRITQRLIRLVQPEKTLDVAGLRIIGMAPAGKDTIHAVDCLGLGLRADLQELVVVDVC